jgi:hypothetical protein
MKFVRRYSDLEYNDDGLAILFEFLEDDTYKSIQYYINWLKNSRRSDSIGGNLTTLEREGELITIIDIHDRFFDDDPLSEQHKNDADLCVLANFLINDVVSANGYELFIRWLQGEYNYKGVGGNLCRLVKDEDQVIVYYQHDIKYYDSYSIPRENFLL